VKAEPLKRPRALVWATALDVLALDAVVERRDGYLVARSPSNPTFYWGNLLLFDDAPAAGDAERWEALFEREFAADPRVAHRTFAWDRSDGVRGHTEEFVALGYDLDDTIGLVAEAGALVPHLRENRAVAIHALDPDGDAALWARIVELQVAGRAERREDEESNRAFARARLDGYRGLFRNGRGGWYAALVPGSGEIAASCGIVVTEGRGRFQVVDTAVAHRRRGIASRLVVEAGRHAAATFGAERFVIAADADYHALGLYESLGFVRAERVYGVCRWPSRA
jgi:ribosomal protein S18 acetylase RimI-like enzyme